MSKLALQAVSWYNGALNKVVSGGAVNTPDRIHLYWRSIVDSLSHPAQNDNPSYVTIPLTQGKSAIVDHEDADLSQLKWCASHRYAVRTNRKGARRTMLLMHRVILER